MRQKTPLHALPAESVPPSESHGARRTVDMDWRRSNWGLPGIWYGAAGDQWRSYQRRVRT
ncbi:hypothetical protein CCMA1212_003106 [Trichoderma ghanense]|uniref:Uncharacterized protein n=1 Tax=Trichoderma ghanense TaxID=65468 RepID=A0ABY2H9I2_9HYPO